MPSCERCWNDSQRDTYNSVERYHELLRERSCTPEEQAGEEASQCPKCGRKTVHMYAKVCMAGCAP